MLEAAQPSATSSSSFAPTTADQLDDAWEGVLDIVVMLKTPTNDARVNGIFAARDAWSDLRSRPRDDYSKPAPVTASQLSQAIATFAQQKAVASELATLYPQKAQVINNGPARKGEVIGPIDITGDVPWWYWALRIGAGVGTGLLIFKTLRPKSSLSGLSGHSALYNPEGLTYQRWLNSARKSKEYYGYSDKRRKQLRAAWKRGEDPAEWI